MNSRDGLLLGGCMLMNSKGRPPFEGLILINSRGRPPNFVRGLTLGTIFMDQMVHILLTTGNFVSTL